MQSTLNFTASQAAKKRGMSRSARNNAVFLVWARSIARMIAVTRGTVTTDDIRRVAVETGHPPATPQAWGSIFKDKEWEFTGNREPSKHIANHGRELKVWRLRK